MHLQITYFEKDNHKMVNKEHFIKIKNYFNKDNIKKNKVK